MSISKSSMMKITANCRNPVDALDRICAAFSDFGDMLEIEFRKPLKGISPEAQYAVVQAYYCDPDYLRGPLLLFRFMRPEEIEKAKAITLPLAKELYLVAKKIDGERAKSNLLLIEAVLQWLADMSHLA